MNPVLISVSPLTVYSESVSVDLTAAQHRVQSADRQAEHDAVRQLSLQTEWTQLSVLHFQSPLYCWFCRLLMSITVSVYYVIHIPHFCPPSFKQGPEVSLRDNFRIKHVCRYALKHYDGLMRLFSLETKRYIPRPISLSPRISVAHCASPEVPLDTLFAVDQKAKINLYGKSGQPAEVNVWSTRQ